MQAHETLPAGLTQYIRSEKLDISYHDFEHIYGALKNKNIYIKKQLEFYEKRFTIAHEVGHYHHGEVFAVEHVHTYNKYSERLADEYALEQLVPERELREKLEDYDWTLSELEVFFGIPKKYLEKKIRGLYL